MPDQSKLADLYAYPDRDLLWLRSNFVASVDGAAQDSDGVSGGLGGKPDHEVFRVLRSLSDVVLVGAGTARTEGYGPITPESMHDSLREGRSATPLLALVSRSLDIPDSLLTPNVMVITPSSSPADERSRIAESVEVLVAGEDEIDWPAVLDSLTARDLKRVLCEGGPDLHGALIEHDLVDEVCVTVSPHLLGGDGKRIAHSPSGVRRATRLGHAIDEDDVLLTRWVRDRRSA